MKQRTRDNLIYLGVAGVIVGALTAYIFYTDKTLGSIPNIPGPILWGILSTPGIVGLILEGFWKHRRRLALWVIIGAAAAINVAVTLTAYFRGWNPPVLEWSMATGLCLFITFILTGKLLTRHPKNRASSR